MARTHLDLMGLLTTLKAAGEPTRLRILALLAHGELNVKDLTEILGQSQPRISRHLKLLAEAGLIERLPEGAWAYYRLGDTGAAAALTRTLIERLNPGDETVIADRLRLERVKAEHNAAAERYFSTNAAEWDRIRKLHISDGSVEEAMQALAGDGPFRAMLDLGTGTGRMLEVFADRYDRAIGIDTSPSMLSVARTNLEKAGIHHAHVRQGDLYALTAPSASFDLVVIHQVLHFLSDPARAIREAARCVRPGGRLIIADFAPHALEFLRSEHAHRRLGFSHDQVAGWLSAAGLKIETIEDLAAPSKDSGKLTVTLWLAEDPRILMADSPAYALEAHA